MGGPEIIAFLAIIMLAIFLHIATKRIPRTKGRIIKNHIIFIVSALLITFILPYEIGLDLFSPLTVVVVGTVYPIYESIRAVCTIDGDDDSVWLQYWIAQAILSFSTEWIDGLAETHPFVREHWYEFEFFFYMWLFLPHTDGATLIFDYFTEPVLAPIIQPIVAKMDNWINKMVLIVVNASHLWFLWIAFVFLNPNLKRFIWICLGTVFPIMSSLISVTTPGYADDTYWLTYWSCFGCLFLITDLLENFLGFIPGFYSIVIFTTVYLMLPMFRGAESVFRNILVPIAGLKEMLIRRDAEKIKLEALKEIPEERRALVLREIAASFERDSVNVQKTKPLVVGGGSDYQSIV